MHLFSTILASAAVLSTVDAATTGLKGFNYGAFFNNQQPKHRADFEYEFKAAKALPGTNGGFDSARLYTMVQWQTQNTVIEAIQAAINTKTKLLLGMWCSSGQATFNNEIVALKAAIKTYGTAFTDLVVGISVGSEDLYRVTPTSINQNGGPGAQPAELIKYIQQTRDAIKGTKLAGKPIGHVDTWTAYDNATNAGVISKLDFLGVDAYPYFQTTMANSIGNANKTFYAALDATIKAAKGKPVWVTEVGWPVTGPTQNQAVASAKNARIFWEDVSCSLIAKKVNIFYYMLQEAQYGNPSPDFGIMGAGDLGALKPRFSLTCPATKKPETASSSSSTEVPTVVSTASLRISDVPTTPVPVPPTPIVSPLGPATPTFDLTGPFQVPQLIVPIEKSNPTAAIGSQFVASISPLQSSLVTFQILTAYAGKTCNLFFHLPPATQEWWQPFRLNAPGGLTVSRLEQPATGQSTSGNVGPGAAVGSIGLVTTDKGELVASAPCEATMSYKVDSVNGLDLQYFQMVTPATGFFMTVAG